MDFTFGVGTYESESLPLSAMKLSNWFFEKQPQGAKSQTPLFGSPGLTEFLDFGDGGPVRQMWNFNGVPYAVSANNLYRFNRDGGIKLIGTGITGDGVVSMSDNGNQLLITNGVAGYLATNAGAFQQIQNPNFFSASTVLFYDNYFLLDRKGTNEAFFSGLQDGLSWSGLDFLSAEAQPGFLIACKQNLQLLFLFCTEHIETWYDSGAADTPFQRYAGGVITRGCLSPYGIVKQDDALFFNGADSTFYRLQGNVPIRVSNHGIERVIQSAGDVAGASCFTYTLRGHKMIHLTLPSINRSLVFDISTNEWHDRESWDASGNSYGRWRGNCALEIFNKILIGDAFSGKVGILDVNAYTEYGNILPGLAVSSTIAADKQRVFVNRLELDMETGVAPSSGQGSAPQILLQWSKDGGKTWSAVQPPRSVGRIGKTLERQRWINLGNAYQWTFRLVITDPVKRVLIGTHLDHELGLEE